jgi:hypothetical protein
MGLKTGNIDLSQIDDMCASNDFIMQMLTSYQESIFTTLKKKNIPLETIRRSLLPILDNEMFHIERQKVYNDDEFYVSLKKYKDDMDAIEKHIAFLANEYAAARAVAKQAAAEAAAKKAAYEKSVRGRMAQLGKKLNESFNPFYESPEAKAERKRRYYEELQWHMKY